MLSVKGSKELKSSAAVFVNPNTKLRFQVPFLLFVCLFLNRDNVMFFQIFILNVKSSETVNRYFL